MRIGSSSRGAVADFVGDDHSRRGLHDLGGLLVADREDLAAAPHLDLGGEGLDVGEIAVHLDQLPAFGIHRVAGNHRGLARFEIEEGGHGLVADPRHSGDDERFGKVEGAEKGRVPLQRGEVVLGDRLRESERIRRPHRLGGGGRRGGLCRNLSGEQENAGEETAQRERTLTGNRHARKVTRNPPGDRVTDSRTAGP